MICGVPTLIFFHPEKKKLLTCPLKKLPVGDLGHLGLNIHAIHVTSEAQVVQPHQLRAATLDAQLQQCTGSVPKAGEIPVLVSDAATQWVRVRVLQRTHLFG